MFPSGKEPKRKPAQNAGKKHFVKRRQNLESDWVNQTAPPLLASLAVFVGMRLRKI